MNKGILAVVGLAVVAGGVLMLLPGNASASPLQPNGEPPEGTPVTPKNAAEAYSLAMNPKMTDAAYVHSLAVWLNSYGQRPDWGAAAERRSMALKAETLLTEGLQPTTTIDRVIEIGQTLAPWPQYATVMGLRVGVMRGGAVPPPFTLDLESGSGTLHIDLSIFKPSSSPGAGGAQTPVGPTPGGASPAQAPPSPSPAQPGVPPPSPPGTTPAGGAAGAPATTPATPLAAEETKPQNDPKGTIALGQMLIAEQAKPNWKYVSQAVKDWQSRVNLTPDGKFGPGAALIMAREVGTLPWIRFFPLGIGDGSQKAAVNDYRGRLKAFALSIAKAEPEHAAALMLSADAETGAGWPKTTPKAAPAKIPTVDQLDARVTELMKAMQQGAS